MQQSSLRLAAVLALALLSPAAMAFDIQSGSSGPGATAQPYAAPEMRFDADGTPRYDVDTDAATHFTDSDGKKMLGSTIDLGPGSKLHFGVSGNAAGSSGRTEPGWDNPQGGRMTR